MSNSWQISFIFFKNGKAHDTHYIHNELFGEIGKKHALTYNHLYNYNFTHLFYCLYYYACKNYIKSHTGNEY